MPTERRTRLEMHDELRDLSRRYPESLNTISVVTQRLDEYLKRHYFVDQARDAVIPPLIEAGLRLSRVNNQNFMFDHVLTVINVEARKCRETIG